MSNKNVYEILNEFKQAKNKKQRMAVLKKNECYALKNVLYAVFNPYITFEVKIPEYKSEEVPEGLSYNNMTMALQQAYLFQPKHPKCPPTLTEKRREELLIQLLEGLEPDEAKVYVGMLQKNLEVPFLTKALINETFPGFLPQ